MLGGTCDKLLTVLDSIGDPLAGLKELRFPWRLRPRNLRLFPLQRVRGPELSDPAYGQIASEALLDYW
jgi:hypothetical protein